MRASKAKGLNRIDKYPCMKDDNLSFINNQIILEL